MPRANQGNPNNPLEQNTNRAVMRSKFQYLPRGLMVDILSRIVCFKTVLNCKCVCKEWLSIISDPQFARLHLPRSPIGILVNVWQSHSPVKKLDLAQIVESAAGSGFGVKKMIFTSKNRLPSFEFELINSCDGLLCLYGPETDGLYVCNPVLGECIAIPPVNNGRCRCGFVALGYNIGTNEYKVLQTTSSNNEFYGEREAEIYTIGTGVWRSLGSVPQTILDVSTDEAIQLPFDAFLHGAQHWAPYDLSEFSIYSFNFEREQFQSLPTPTLSPGIVEAMHERYSDYLQLGQLGGCLLLCVHDKPSTKLEFWVMKEYGFQQSWTQILVIDNLSPRCFGYMPIMFLSNGEILIAYVEKQNNCSGSRLVGCYNQEAKTFRRTTVTDLTQEFFHAIAYSPSFVSLYDVAKGEEVKRISDRKKSKKHIGKSKPTELDFKLHAFDMWFERNSYEIYFLDG
ncbi:F-box/kelch-repeat protein At3g23880 [Pyrus x bretschneideri]|uniref:F-box/kelch-repeat protein At3g23880 n=1 Tax=Pyrus x bretschneideri TaxID=225117 RepID=UPI00202DE539|nr:F-box/kelch-repeat protein At3g23880 [Pyrus x bretschneideri]XP_048446170.1 F-box/kelch-repeat protein At3g23880 [Pyrus x bretschneideri]